MPARRAALQRLALFGTLALPAWQAGRAAEPASAAAGVSEAERLLFQQPHLAGIRLPNALLYRFESHGRDGDVEDRIRIVLTEGNGGACCTARGEYRTGARAVRLPEVTDARSNPVLLYFLEDQVRQLERRTGGRAGHFRRMTRLAIAGAASVSAGTVRWNGADLPARTVRIAPYLDDPYRNRFAAEARTEYSFVLCDGVPGVVYRLRAVVPGSPPVRDETVTLEGLESNGKR